MTRKKSQALSGQLFPEDQSAADSDERAEVAPRAKDDLSFSKPYRVAFAVVGEHPERGPAAFGAVVSQGKFQTEWSLATSKLGRDDISAWGQDFIRRICWRVQAMRPEERVPYLEDTDTQRNARAMELAKSKLATVCAPMPERNGHMNALRIAREILASNVLESHIHTSFKYE